LIWVWSVSAYSVAGQSETAATREEAVVAIEAAVRMDEEPQAPYDA
jgi:hypothetical protein